MDHKEVNAEGSKEDESKDECMSYVLPNLCRCELRRLWPICSLVTAVSRARLIARVRQSPSDILSS